MTAALAPRITSSGKGTVPDGHTAFWWAVALAIIPAVMAFVLGTSTATTAGAAVDTDLLAQANLLGGLLLFGGFFAVNSALHSYLIVSYATDDGVSLDVGFYYMANAMGRLLGTVLSGWIYQAYGLQYCLWVSAGFIGIAALLSLRLPRHS